MWWRRENLFQQVTHVFNVRSLTCDHVFFSCYHVDETREIHVVYPEGTRCFSYTCCWIFSSLIAVNSFLYCNQRLEFHKHTNNDINVMELLMLLCLQHVKSQTTCLSDGRVEPPPCFSPSSQHFCNFLKTNNPASGFTSCSGEIVWVFEILSGSLLLSFFTQLLLQSLNRQDVSPAWPLSEAVNLFTLGQHVIKTGLSSKAQLLGNQHQYNQFTLRLWSLTLIQIQMLSVKGQISGCPFKWEVRSLSSLSL